MRTLAVRIEAQCARAFMNELPASGSEDQNNVRAPLGQLSSSLRQLESATRLARGHLVTGKTSHAKRHAKQAGHSICWPASERAQSSAQLSLKII